MEFCSTPYGKRNFQRWLCKPLRRIVGINDRLKYLLVPGNSQFPIFMFRLDAVEDLNNNTDFQETIRKELEAIKTIDLERLISRIHAGTAKLKQFVMVLQTFDKIWVSPYLCVYIVILTFHKSDHGLYIFHTGNYIPIQEQNPESKTTPPFLPFSLLTYSLSIEATDDSRRGTLRASEVGQNQAHRVFKNSDNSLNRYGADQFQLQQTNLTSTFLNQ